MLGFDYYLPGTGIENSQPLSLSLIVFICFIASPLIAIFSLVFIYKDINDLNDEDLRKSLSKLPKNIQIQLLENLKNLNKRFYEEI